MRAWMWISVLVFGFSLLAEADELVFKKRGQVVKKVDVGSIPSELKVPSTIATVWELHEDRVRPYKAFAMNALLTAVYGTDWQKTEEILFTCTDGYQVGVSVDRFKQHLSYLAFDSTEGKFRVANHSQNEKDVALGPFYLVWENIKDQDSRKAGGRDWPYQVTSIDLIQFSERYPTIAPAPGSSAAVKHGFVLYKDSCMTCHKLNGEGGERGPELNYPVSVTEYIKENWLEKWIKDASSIRANVVMPSQPQLNPKDVKDLVSYLKAMAKNKKAPIVKESK